MEDMEFERKKILVDFNIITVSFWFSTFYFSDELQLDIIEEKRKE